MSTPEDTAIRLEPVPEKAEEKNKVADFVATFFVSLFLGLLYTAGAVILLIMDYIQAPVIPFGTFLSFAIGTPLVAHLITFLFTRQLRLILLSLLAFGAGAGVVLSLFGLLAEACSDMNIS